MRFRFRPTELRVFRPDGTRFLSFQELDDRVQEVERQRLAERRSRSGCGSRSSGGL
jgi:hypothetical protein